MRSGLALAGVLGVATVAVLGQVDTLQEILAQLIAVRSDVSAPAQVEVDAAIAAVERAIAIESPPPPPPPPPGEGPMQAVPSALLGTCSAALHDSYAAIGPDGRTYRTWHATNDPSGCYFGHEHGDPPHPAAPPPLFGYQAFHAGAGELGAHQGFKVFTHIRGQLTGWGTRELITVTPDWDMMVMIHQGTSGAGRLTIRFHSFSFWARDQRGRVTNVHVMGDTGEAALLSSGANPSPGRFIVDHEQPVYELWDFAVNVGGAWSTLVTAAVTNPMNHAHSLSGPLVSTSEELCGINFPPCDVFLPFGHAESFWMGNMRTLHNPDWTWSNDGPETFCTDVFGVRVADALCGQDGFLQQRVASLNRSFVSEVWDRTMNAIPDALDAYWGRVPFYGGN